LGQAVGYAQAVAVIVQKYGGSSVADVDKPGVRIAVGLNSAYDLYLTRTLKNATLVRAKTGTGPPVTTKLWQGAIVCHAWV
jgi:hypothetical protein